jgi:beta-lactam-binding protein with PASTA domain
MNGPLLKKAARWGATLAALTAVGIVAFNGAMGWLLHSHEEVTVPSVVGKMVDEALGILSKPGLTLSQESVEYDESMPPGAILRQKPNSGMTVRKGRVIRVVVSKGGQKIFVPDVSGKSVSDAQTLVTGAGLALGEVSEAYSTVVSRGLTVAQIPKAGEVVAKGSLVDLRVSRGKPPDSVKLMPDLRNKHLEEVRAWSGKESLSLSVRESTASAALPGVVVDQDPPPDQTLEPGAQIQVVVGSLRRQGAAVQISYGVPQGTEKAQVRIVTRDELGEHEIFKGERNPGDALNVPLVPSGPTRVRIYLNDVLVDERIVGQ